MSPRSNFELHFEQSYNAEQYDMLNRYCTLHLFAILLVLFSVTSLTAEVSPAPSQTSMSIQRQTSTYSVYNITFPSPVQNANPPNGTVYVEYYTPRSAGQHPGVVLLHHWGVVNLSPERQLAKTLVESGIATAIMIMPYHLQRTPPGFESGTAMIGPNVQRMVRSIEQAEVEISSLVSWLKSRPEIDPNRIGIVGVSLGAIIGALSIDRSNQFNAAVLILGGADVAKIVWESPITYKARRGLREQGYTEARLRTELAPIEPLNTVAPMPKGSLLMVNGLYDPVITRQETADLWNAFGRPEIIWVEAGHYLPPWARTRIYGLTRDFLLSRFGLKSGFNAPERIRLRRLKLGLLFDEAPVVGIGGAVELLKPANTPVSLDLNLTTGGVSFGACVNIGRNMSIGAQRKIFSDETRILPYVMVYITI